MCAGYTSHGLCVSRLQDLTNRDLAKQERERMLNNLEAFIFETQVHTVHLSISTVDFSDPKCKFQEFIFLERDPESLVICLLKCWRDLLPRSHWFFEVA